MAEQTTLTTTTLNSRSEEALSKKAAVVEQTTLSEYIAAKQLKKKKLASGYTPSKRRMEIASVTVFVMSLIANVYLIAPYFSLSNSLQISFASVCGILLADWVSGMVHWAADTWGTTEWPIVGNTFIRSFREHHVDPTAMTKHDFIETNGDNCLVSILFALFPHVVCGGNGNNVVSVLRGVQPLTMTNTQMFTFFCFTWFAIFAALTNQIHKWAHTFKPPAIVCLLQDYNIILGRKNHNVHHKNPFDRHYCITTGWMNPVLDAVGYWKFLETVISAVTGLVPRQDDQVWNDHLALLEREKLSEKKTK